MWVETNRDDPPDRYLRWQDQRLGLELTELTIGDVRAAESDARRLRTSILAEIDREPDAFAHLVGRHVLLTRSPPDLMPRGRRVSDVSTAISAALRDDRGFVGEGLVLAGPDTMPETLPDRGFYGLVEGFDLLVNSGTPGVLGVSVPCAARLRQSEAVAALQERVDAKDDSRNGAIVISCGFPNEAGEVSTADFAIFQHLVEMHERGELHIRQPKHAGLVVLQYFGGTSIDLFRDQAMTTPWD